MIYTGDQSKSASGLVLTLHAYEASTGQTLFNHPLPSLSSPYLGFQPGPLFQVAAGAVTLVIMGPPTQGEQPHGQPQFVNVILSLSASDGSLRWHQSVNDMVTLVLISP